MKHRILTALALTGVFACAETPTDHDEGGIMARPITSQASNRSLRGLLESAASVDVVRIGAGQPHIVETLRGHPASTSEVAEAVEQRSVNGCTKMLVITHNDGSVLGFPISDGPESPGVELSSVREALL